MNLRLWYVSSLRRNSAQLSSRYVPFSKTNTFLGGYFTVDFSNQSVLGLAKRLIGAGRGSLLEQTSPHCGKYPSEKTERYPLQCGQKNRTLANARQKWTLKHINGAAFHTGERSSWQPTCLGTLQSVTIYCWGTAQKTQIQNCDKHFVISHLWQVNSTSAKAGTSIRPGKANGLAPWNIVKSLCSEKRKRGSKMNLAMRISATLFLKYGIDYK